VVATYGVVPTAVDDRARTNGSLSLVEALTNVWPQRPTMSRIADAKASGCRVHSSGRRARRWQVVKRTSVGPRALSGWDPTLGSSACSSGGIPRARSATRAAFRGSRRAAERELRPESPPATRHPRCRPSRIRARPVGDRNDRRPSCAS